MNHLLFVGLGNPGKQFNRTRHNFGIRLLRIWADAKWQPSAKHQAEIATVTLANTKITCLFPAASMNLSGQAVASFNHLPEKTLIIHDDIELPLGDFKIKLSGSARGHRGVRSIHEALGTQDIARLLLGVGPVIGLTEEFVLSKFTPGEEEIIVQLLPRAGKILTEFAQEKSSPHNPTDE
ncbi:MAG: aminoacyl-tRNA hydrolase [bacterium]